MMMMRLVETPHITQPKALPNGACIPYSSNVCMTKIGKEPIPPGVTIIESVANVSTENAALIGNVAVASIPLNPTYI